MSTDKKILNFKSLTAYIFLLVTSAAVLFFATKSSPFYLYNEWCDANSYFTVGKSLFNGLVPYRDVFDQKGMYLYFSYGLCYLVSHTSFFGVYLMEVILGFLDLLAIRKTILLFTDKDRIVDCIIASVLSPVILAVVVSSYSFYMGGAAEELCLPLYFWGLYLILKYSKNHEFTGKLPFIGGLLSGLVANIKFTGLGFFFAWMAWLFFDLIFQKEVAKAFKACLWFLLGMFIPFIPWLVYFGIQKELYSWYWGYIWVNVFSYSDFSESLGIGNRIYNLAKTALWTFQQNPIVFALGYMGILFAMFKKSPRIWDRFLAPILFGFMFLGIYVGGSFLPYYALPLSSFCIFCSVYVAEILSRLTSKVTLKNAVPAVCLLCAALVSSLLLVFFTSMNVPDHNIKKEDHYLTQMTDVIQNSGIEKPTLLTINRLDCGLYTTCDIIPNIRWFQTQTFNSELPYTEQQRYIEEGLVDFVFAQDFIPGYLSQNYELVSEIPWYSEKTNKTFYLFKKLK